MRLQLRNYGEHEHRDSFATTAAQDGDGRVVFNNIQEAARWVRIDSAPTVTRTEPITLHVAELNVHGGNVWGNTLLAS